MKYQALNELKSFEDMGITVLPFMGKLHRKLAIVDRNILWEGSLNILSQRDSHEIMRRFMGKETAQQMMTFLKLDKNIGKAGENELQRCEFCKEPGAWYWTDKSKYGGLWTFCLVSGHKKGTEPKDKEDASKAIKSSRQSEKAKVTTNEDGIPVCPEHNHLMIKKTGRYGVFWGCPKYPACKITYKVS